MNGKYRLQRAEEQYWTVSAALGASLIRSSGRYFELASVETRIRGSGLFAVISEESTLRSDGQK